MKLTLTQIYRATPALRRLAMISLPVKVSMRVALNLQELNPIFDSLNEARNQIGEKYRKEGTSEVDQKYFDKFSEEWADALEGEKEVSLMPIKLSDLDGISVEPQVLLELMFLIEDKEEKTE